MSEAISDVMSNLRDHAPTMPSASDAREAVLSHLPSNVDLPKVKSKRSLAAIVAGALAIAAAIGVFVRRRQATNGPTSPGMYTPPLPKP